MIIVWIRYFFLTNIPGSFENAEERFGGENTEERFKMTSCIPIQSLSCSIPVSPFSSCGRGTRSNQYRQVFVGSVGVACFQKVLVLIVLSWYKQGTAHTMFANKGRKSISWVFSFRQIISCCSASPGRMKITKLNRDKRIRDEILPRHIYA